jgi:CrcB protein
LSYVIVFFGAGIGGALRHGVNVATARLLGTGFPAWTMIVNIGGSFAMGLLAGWFLARPGFSQDMRLFLTTGILGGFTTFSAFSLDVAVLAERGAYGMAAAYALGTVTASVAALFAGLWLSRGSAGLP